MAEEQARSLQVLMVHGTWASDAEWTRPESSFYRNLRKSLEPRYRGRITPSSYQWTGRNRWNARKKAVNELVALIRDKAKVHPADDLLLIGHSHGGNVATEAAREALAAEADLRLVGVVCMATPFLHREPRGLKLGLLLWGLVSALLALGVQMFAWDCPWIEPMQRALDAVYGGAPHAVKTIASYNVAGWSLFSIVLTVFAALTTFFGIVGGFIRTDRGWRPRPRVLCLSCADDEAITVLGLVEGVANLPQLVFFHPFMLGLLSVPAIYLLLAFGQLPLCSSGECWTRLLAAATHAYAYMFLGSVTFAMVAGILGALFLTFVFGLSPLQTIQTVVARVLVSYTPLADADSYFRAVSLEAFSWKNIGPSLQNLSLRHWMIYRLRETTRNIAEWVDHVYPVAVDERVPLDSSIPPGIEARLATEPLRPGAS